MAVKDLSNGPNEMDYLSVCLLALIVPDLPQGKVDAKASELGLCFGVVVFEGEIFPVGYFQILASSGCFFQIAYPCYISL